MSREFKKYLLSLALFGSNGIVASAIALPATQIVLLRTLLGALLLVAALGLSRLRPGERKRAGLLEHPRQAWALACSGAALGVGWIFLFEAYQLVGVGIASLAYYCGPVIVMALSPFLFGERLTPAKLAGFAAVALGAFLVACQPGGAALDPRGLMLGALSAVMYAVMVVFSRRAPKIQGLEAASIQIVSGLAAVALHAAATGGVPSLSALAAANLPAVALLGIVNTGIGCYLYFSSIGRLPVQRVAVCGYLEPLGAVLLSVLLLGEPLTPCRALGATLVMGGAAACELWGKGLLRLPASVVAISRKIGAPSL